MKSIMLENRYGFERHVIMDVAELPSDAEYIGTSFCKGVEYDCYHVPNGICYESVCVNRKKRGER